VRLPGRPCRRRRAVAGTAPRCICQYYDTPYSLGAELAKSLPARSWASMRARQAVGFFAARFCICEREEIKGAVKSEIFDWSGY